MPASSAEVIGAALQTAFRHPPSSARPNSLTPAKASLQDQLSVCGKQVLYNQVEYEHEGNQQSLRLNNLKAKYVTITKASPTAPRTPCTPPPGAMSQGTTRGQGAKEDQMEDPNVTLWARDKVMLGWRKSFPPGAGMVNLGNTCYLNSSLQALFHIPSLANWLLEELQSHTQRCEATTTNATFCSVCAMMRTMRATLERSSPVIKPALIQHKLKMIGKTLMYGRQEDAHEFIKLLLDHMEKSYLAFRRATKLDHRSKETTPLNQIFGGYLRQQVICPLCRYVSTTFSHFQDLALDIRTTNSVDDALNLYFRKETLDSENAYRCERCHRKVPATKRHLIERAPHVLLIQLKRFTMSGGKIGKHVNIQRTIDITRFVSGGAGGAKGGGGGGGPYQYRLTSMVIHLGGSQHGGHYTAVAEASSGTMFEFDDSSVRSISLQSALLRNPYILFYEMIRRPKEISSVKQVVRQSSEKVLIRQNSDGVPVKPLPTSQSASSITNGFCHPAGAGVGVGVKGHHPQTLPCHKEREKLSFALKTSTTKALGAEGNTATASKPNKILLHSHSSSLLLTKTPPPSSSSSPSSTSSLKTTSSKTVVNSSKVASSSSSSSSSSSPSSSSSSKVVLPSSSSSSSSKLVLPSSSSSKLVIPSSSSSSTSKLVLPSSSTTSTSTTTSKLVTPTPTSTNNHKGPLTSTKTSTKTPNSTTTKASTPSTTQSSTPSSTQSSTKGTVPSLVPYLDDSDDSETDDSKRGTTSAKITAKMNGVGLGIVETGTKRVMVPRALQVVLGGARTKGDTAWQVTDAALHSPSECSSTSSGGGTTKPFNVVEQPSTVSRQDPKPESDTQGWTVTEKTLSQECVAVKEGDSASLRSKASVDSGRSDRSTKSMKRSIMSLFTCVSSARSPESPTPPSDTPNGLPDTTAATTTATTTTTTTTTTDTQVKRGREQEEAEPSSPSKKTCQHTQPHQPHATTKQEPLTTTTTTTTTVAKNGPTTTPPQSPPPQSPPPPKNCPDVPTKNGLSAKRAKTKSGNAANHNGTASTSTSTSSLSSSSDTEEEEGTSGRWVEKTKETMGTARLHPKPAVVEWNGATQKEKKKGLWEGSKSSSVVDELRRAGNMAYGTEVNAWNGGRSEADQEVERLRRETKKRSASDLYNEEMDYGKTKKLKIPNKKGGGGWGGSSSSSPPPPAVAAPPPSHPNTPPTTTTTTTLSRGYKNPGITTITTLLTTLITTFTTGTVHTTITTTITTTLTTATTTTTNTTAAHPATHNTQIKTTDPGKEIGRNSTTIRNIGRNINAGGDVVTA